MYEVSARFKPGDRVRWVVEQGDPEDMVDERGTVRPPTAEELAYVATWSPTARSGITQHVLVVWDGDQPRDGAWIYPDDLQDAGPSDV